MTTATYTGPSRLWRLRFDDGAFPDRGGTITMLLGGNEGQHMFDNLTITRRGQILLEEDPGVPTVAPDHLAAIWRYTIETNTLKAIARHDPERFVMGSPGFLTRDEEASGIIDVTDILGEGWFLLTVQAPYNIGESRARRRWAVARAARSAGPTVMVVCKTHWGRRYSAAPETFA